MRTLRATKILATIGPASAAPEVLRSLADAGMDGARINLSHGCLEEWVACAQNIRALSQEIDRPITVLADLQGPKIRLAADTDRREIGIGEEVIIVSGRETPEGSLAIAWDEVCQAAVPGQSEIIVGDGTPRLSVVDRATYLGAPALVATCTRSGQVGPRKGAFVTHVSSSAPALSEKDLDDLDHMREIDPDLVALSFVRGPADIDTLRRELDARGLLNTRIVAKIEKAEAMSCLDEIVERADAIMVARGDLGIELGIAAVPLAQKRIIRAAASAGKLVITATQMLESMHHSSEPTRAEATDVANAILDGTSAVMLSGETAQGSFPVEAVLQMDAIARAAEAGGMFALEHDAAELDEAEAVMMAAALLGDKRRCSAFIVPTETGGSARAIARQRPAAPILALCHHPRVARQMALERGVVPRHFPALDQMDEMIEEAMAAARTTLVLSDSDTVVLCYGPVVARRGATNLIVIRRAGDAPA
ncbi:pyruvate kinase [Miltoncostaea oceani]|uniref:pyruvate kinase n=1 Tax=Miltoncostaea oceani TaxID=2843216 RepID=UPI001C3CBD63|nr:pyruvate kinase [Miltoncostaea oceani]